MNSIIATNIARFILLLLVQVLVLNHINFLGHINPYLYLLFIILFPVKNNRMLFIFLSFLIGLLVDVFSDTGGIHAAASVTIAFLRPGALKFSFGAVYDHQSVKFNAIDTGQMLSYMAILITIHHLILFFLEIFNFFKVILILKNTLFSCIFTLLLCVLVTILFSRTSK